MFGPPLLGVQFFCGARVFPEAQGFRDRGFFVRPNDLCLRKPDQKTKLEPSSGSAVLWILDKSGSGSRASQNGREAV